jgi:hypothetical protein
MDFMRSIPRSLGYYLVTHIITSLDLSPGRDILSWLDFPLLIMICISYLLHLLSFFGHIVLPWPILYLVRLYICITTCLSVSICYDVIDLFH